MSVSDRTYVDRRLDELGKKRPAHFVNRRALNVRRRPRIYAPRISTRVWAGR